MTEYALGLKVAGASTASKIDVDEAQRRTRDKGQGVKGMAALKGTHVKG